MKKFDILDQFQAHLGADGCIRSFKKVGEVQAASADDALRISKLRYRLAMPIVEDSAEAEARVKFAALARKNFR